MDEISSQPRSIRIAVSEKLNDRAVIHQLKGDYKAAFQTWSKAISVCDDYHIPWYNLGNLLRTVKKYEAAAWFYERAIDIQPDMIDAWRNLAPIYRHLGDRNKALACYNTILNFMPNDETALHFQAALEERKLSEAHNRQDGKLLPSEGALNEIENEFYGQEAPHQYVKDLFNGCSKTFDQQLLVNLNYTAPEIFTEIIKEISQKSTSTTPLFPKAADLGCGTGIIGKVIRPYSDFMEGVDLAGGMLDVAESKKIYDVLNETDISSWLTETKPQQWNLIIMADVLLYLGDLGELIQKVKNALCSNSWFMFTTEENENSDSFHLQKSGRFAHSFAYTKSILESLSFSIYNYQRMPLRSQPGKQVMGGFYTCQLKMD
ncbi:MAG: hypothetical protein CMP10_17735 [Zetaproteobacteria bacterium]|nr:hypothetical protein [Pseudobdellovibrionaceae bacterium]|tara:strand:- start:34 stop:1158 length:1125 start_codon:yes stop_codon:yes gene_type:complete